MKTETDFATISATEIAMRRDNFESSRSWWSWFMDENEPREEEVRITAEIIRINYQLFVGRLQDEREKRMQKLLKTIESVNEYPSTKMWGCPSRSHWTLVQAATVNLKKEKDSASEIEYYRGIAPRGRKWEVFAFEKGKQPTSDNTVRSYHTIIGPYETSAGAHRAMEGDEPPSDEAIRNAIAPSNRIKCSCKHRTINECRSCTSGECDCSEMANSPSFFAKEDWKTQDREMDRYNLTTLSHCCKLLRRLTEHFHEWVRQRPELYDLNYEVVWRLFVKEKPEASNTLYEIGQRLLKRSGKKETEKEKKDA